jgi:CRISPR-associated protein Cas2
LPVGHGSPEVSVVLIYDIEDDRLRTRVSDICLDYGLDRIQFSAFFGKLNRNRRQELALKLARQVEEESARIRIYPICENDLRDMWSLEQYRRDADELAAAADRRDSPKLKVLKSEE